jgi:tetratricopeptide (TPR) repeat protein
MPQKYQTLSLFISYRRTDSAFVDRLEVDLRVRDFDTWLDRRDLASRGGANWKRELQIAIDRAHALVLVLTPEAADSPYVGWEYRYAALLGRPIYVLLLKDCPKGVPAEILADGVKWLDFRAEADYSRALYDLVMLLMDLPVDPPSPRPDGVRFADDSPVVLRPMGAIETSRSTQQSDAELDELYRRAVQAEIAGNLDRATDLFQRILHANPSYRNHYVGNRMPDMLRKRQQVWLDRLKKIAYEARLEGEWGLEIAAWNATMTESGGDPRAQAGLDLARRHHSFAWLYKEALSAYNNGDVAVARHQLQELWKNAPDYGDPARLAPELGLPARQTRESTGLVPTDVVRQAQAEYAQLKRADEAKHKTQPSETDELEALSPDMLLSTPFPLNPGERLIKQMGVTWYQGLGWNVRTLYMTTQRIVLWPAGLGGLFNQPPHEIRFEHITNLERAMVLMINPVVRITLVDGSEVQLILTSGSELSYGNREEFIALVRRLMNR